MTWDHVRVERQDGIAVVTLARPERRNAMHAPMWRELREVGEHLAEEPARVVILHADGEHFSAGMDLRPDNPLITRLGPAVANKDQGACRALIRELKGSLDVFAHLPCPVVAAIEGACLGSGLELALCADLRVVAESAVFTLPETRWGLVPDVGGTVRLSRLIGRGRAGDMILTGRKVASAEALSWGLVNRVVPDGSALQAADTLARALRKGAPKATAAILPVLRDADTLSRSDAFDAETEAGVRALMGQEILQGIQAFVTRSDPPWAS